MIKRYHITLQFSMTMIKSISLLIGILLVSCSTTSAAVVHIPPVVKNLARGSFLKCAADLSGGLVSERYDVEYVLFFFALLLVTQALL